MQNPGDQKKTIKKLSIVLPAGVVLLNGLETTRLQKAAFVHHMHLCVTETDSSLDCITHN